jgi:Family of unknown function (DUF6093)
MATTTASCPGISPGSTVLRLSAGSSRSMLPQVIHSRNGWVNLRPRIRSPTMTDMGLHIPSSALAALARVLEDEMTTTCLIEREQPGPGTYDRDTGVATIPRSEVYYGKCYLGDRVEGAFASGGFGGNPQEYAFDSRTHFSFLRLPYGSTEVKTGDLVTIEGEQWRVTARERSSSRVSATHRVVRYDPDASRA